MVLNSGITPNGAQRMNKIPGTKPELAMCKANYYLLYYFSMPVTSLKAVKHCLVDFTQ